MVFFRNVQVRWMPIQGDQPADAWPSNGRGRRATPACWPTVSSCENVKGRSPLPDLTGEYRWGGSAATSKRPACSAG